MQYVSESDVAGGEVRFAVFWDGPAVSAVL